MKTEAVKPMGFLNARELTQSEISSVGGARAQQTFHLKVTYNNGNDAEAEYDIEW